MQEAPQKFKEILQALSNLIRHNHRHIVHADNREYEDRDGEPGGEVAQKICNVPKCDRHDENGLVSSEEEREDDEEELPKNALRKNRRMSTRTVTFK